METITMIQDEHLDIRTITMGISLMDCCDSDIDVSCRKVYDKIYRLAKDLVKTGEEIEKKYGIPIVCLLYTSHWLSKNTCPRKIRCMPRTDSDAPL